MAKRKAAKRELIDTGSDKRYVRRNPAGRLKESDDVGKSLSQDRKRKPKKEGQARAGRPRGSLGRGESGGVTIRRLSRVCGRRAPRDHGKAISDHHHAPDLTDAAPLAMLPS